MKRPVPNPKSRVLEEVCRLCIGGSLRLVLQRYLVYAADA